MISEGVKEAIREGGEQPSLNKKGPPFPAITCMGPDTESTSLSVVT